MAAALQTQGIVRLEEITSTRELESFREDWISLWSRCPAATPFQSPEWLIPWWKHLGRGELWVLVIRVDGRLRSMAPCHIVQDSPDGPRKVLLLGTGISDYLDVLVEPGFEETATTAVMAHLFSNFRLWDTCDLQQLPGTSPLLTFACRDAYSSEVTVQEVCPVLQLRDPDRPIPSSMLQKLRYYRNKAQKKAPTQLDTVRQENLDELFESFVRLHRARWGALGQNGVLASDGLTAFHREVAGGMLNAGLLRLYGLRLGRELVAMLYGFAHARRMYYYLGGFAPEVAALSPGTLLIGHAIEQAVTEGAEEFDFLRGREAYKYMWGAKGNLNYRRQFRRPRACVSRERRDSRSIPD